MNLEDIQQNQRSLSAPVPLATLEPRESQTRDPRASTQGQAGQNEPIPEVFPHTAQTSQQANPTHSSWSLRMMTRVLFVILGCMVLYFFADTLYPLEVQKRRHMIVDVIGGSAEVGPGSNDTNLRDAGELSLVDSLRDHAGSVDRETNRQSASTNTASEPAQSQPMSPSQMGEGSDTQSAGQRTSDEQQSESPSRPSRSSLGGLVGVAQASSFAADWQHQAEVEVLAVSTRLRRINDSILMYQHFATTTKHQKVLTHIRERLTMLQTTYRETPDDMYAFMQELRALERLVEKRKAMF